ncbi:MAG: M48 family metalloprotease [Elusimicrobiota bacterium]
MRRAAVLSAALLLAGLAPSRAERKYELKELGRKGEKYLQKGAEIAAEFHLTPESERELGREVAARLIGRFGIYEDDALTRYVGLVGNTLIRKAKRGGMTYHFGILNSRSVNAYAAPGGYVFVTRGLLQRLGNEAQLAGVLAHEIVHVDDKHAIQGIRVMKGAGLGLEKLNGGGGAHRLAELAVEYIADKGYSRQQETASDHKGLGILAASGYHPDGLPAALKRLYGGEHAPSKGSFDSRHPPLAQRLQELDRELKNYPAQGAILKSRFQKNVVFN